MAIKYLEGTLLSAGNTTVGEQQEPLTRSTGKRDIVKGKPSRVGVMASLRKRPCCYQTSEDELELTRWSHWARRSGTEERVRFAAGSDPELFRTQGELQCARGSGQTGGSWEDEKR